MKYLYFIVLALALLFVQEANAKSIKDMSEAIKNSITLDAKNSKLLSVTFNHSSHRGISCFTCHHMKTDKNDRYVPCSTCHNQLGRSTEKLSLFTAFHTKDSKHSCYACHTSLRTKSPGKYGVTFANCRPCHSLNDVIKAPITMEAKKSKLLNVTFNHSSHKGISCFACHHMVSKKNGRYVPCSECHVQKGRSMDPKSMFTAAHSKNVDHSCYACHDNLAQSAPNRYAKTFYNCRPCHTGSTAMK
ncbi:MAG: cytochrome c3 family protein [Desulfovibrionaceae bacterium]|nr:cytochrome c3 family protein [Desulfovibrionaceae bacterium]